MAAKLKEEAERRAVLEAELSQVLRPTVEDQEAERQRIARELHDTLGQSLTLLQLGLDGLGRCLPEASDLQARIAALKSLANGVGAEVNRLAWEIRPTALDDLGLETAIRHLTEIWAERSGVPIGLHLALNDRRLRPGGRDHALSRAARGAYQHRPPCRGDARRRAAGSERKGGPHDRRR